MINILDSIELRLSLIKKLKFKEIDDSLIINVIRDTVFIYRNRFDIEKNCNITEFLSVELDFANYKINPSLNDIYVEIEKVLPGTLNSIFYNKKSELKKIFAFFNITHEDNPDNKIKRLIGNDVYLLFSYDIETGDNMLKFYYDKKTTKELLNVSDVTYDELMFFLDSFKRRYSNE